MSVHKQSTGSVKVKVVISLLAVAAIIAALEITNTTSFFHTKPVPKTIPLTKEKPRQSDQSKSTVKVSKPGQTSKVAGSTGSPGSSTSLLQPYGDLVSNHKPGQNGSDTKEQSVCNTTPGASCYIKFTKTDGTTTRLPAQKVGSDGSALWSWDAKILSPGDWQVTAVASLNGQTKSVTDSLKLEVR